MIVVLVLMTNCQVSLKLKMGPVRPQIIMIERAKKNVDGSPARCAAAFANRLNQECFLFIQCYHRIREWQSPWMFRNF